MNIDDVEKFKEHWEYELDNFKAAIDEDDYIFIENFINLTEESVTKEKL